MKEDLERVIPRRNFARALGSWAVRGAMLGGGLFGIHELRSSETPPHGGREALGILRPPGSLAEEPFLASCIRCTRCADACEAQCIRFFGSDAGQSQDTPYIQADDRACTLCFACGEACPAGSIVPLVEMSEAAMGLAVVDERLCVSHNGTGMCGACFTICPLKGKAITQDYHNAPMVHKDACVGCGLCEEICIVRDRRAIQVFTERPWKSDPERASA